MNKEDYFKYYIQGSDHYLIPKDIFDELFNEMVNWKEESKELKRKLNEAIHKATEFESEVYELKKQLEYLRSGEYLNQLRFERDMLQDLVDKKEISKEDKEFIDMTRRNTELLEQQKEFISYLENKIYSIEPKGTGINYYCEYDSEEDYISAMKEQSKLNTLKETLSKYKSIIGE